MNKKFLLIAGVFILGGAIIGGVFNRISSKFTASGTITNETIAADYKEALEVIGANYVRPVEHEKVAESSIQAMLWSLDPHSSFFTRTEFKKLYEDQQSRFYGIGVSILQHRDGVYVQAVVPGTPAEKVGLRYGDRFVEVDGKNATEWTSSELSRNVRGERGTTVNVKIERVGSEKPITFEITRDGVPYPSIRNFFMLKDDIGYIGLTGGFQETTAEELDQAMTDLKKQGMKQVVLDLRGNPGGLLPQAVEVVSRFVPRGQVVVSVKGRSRYATQQELRTLGSKTEEMPLVVLINGGSASASEIVAGAVQDYGRGMIVGSDSFGKGLVQRIFQLPSGTGLTLTMARYYTPYGRSLQRDYSNGSIYEYFTHQDAESNSKTDADIKPKGEPVETANGRVLYGGRGIEPDIKVQSPSFTTLRYRLNEAAFFFTRQVVAGKVAGLEGLRVEKTKNDHILRPNELEINDKILESFRAFVAQDSKSGLSAENLSNNLDYVKTRLREELATANYSNEAGSQVLLEVDPQVLKAIEVLPEAKKLAENFKSNNNIG
jgi:carboxyl-terminal processing protease